MNKTKLFPLVDYPTASDAIKLIGKEKYHSMNIDERMIFTKKAFRALWTGEKRCPKDGEWFLSGAEVEAYRAPNDLGTVHLIARLVLVKVKTIETIEIIAE